MQRPAAGAARAKGLAQTAIARSLKSQPSGPAGTIGNRKTDRMQVRETSMQVDEKPRPVGQLI